MRINEIYIEGFGGLSRFSLKLDGGLNSFVFPNGYGKTTLTYFIKAIFYGLDDGRHRSISDSDRRRFIPWGGGSFGGWISFVNNGKEYRVERFFGTRPAEDSFALYDRTGRISSDYTERLGYEIFGIDDDGFERTAFLSDKNLSGETDNTTISAKLSNLTSVEGDINGMDSAIKELEKQSKVYKKRGGKGEISELEARLFETEREILGVEEIAQRIPNSERELAELSARIEALSVARRELLAVAIAEEKRAGISALFDKYEDMRLALKDAEARVAEARRFFGGYTPTEAEIDKKRDALVEAIAARGKASERQTDGGTEACPPKKPRICAWCPLFAFAFAIFTLLGAISSPLFFIGAFAMLAAFTAALSLGGKYRAELRDFMREEERHSKEEESRRTSLIATEEKIKDAESFLSLFPLSGSAMEKFDTLRLMRRKLDALEQTESRLRLETEDFKKRNLPEGYQRNESTGANDASSARERLYSIDSESDLLLRQRSALEARITADIESADRLDELKERCAEYREKIASYKKRHELIERTLMHLKTAKDNMTARYLDGTRASFLKYLRLISAGEDGFTMDTSFAIKKSEAGALREAAAFSKGTRELYALCLRLALIDALYGEDAPPIVLDDPFAYFDDEKCQRALGLIRALGEVRQIIYLTCASARK